MLFLSLFEQDRTDTYLPIYVHFAKFWEHPCGWVGGHIYVRKVVPVSSFDGVWGCIWLCCHPFLSMLFGMLVVVLFYLQEKEEKEKDGYGFPQSASHARHSFYVILILCYPVVLFQRLKERERYLL